TPELVAQVEGALRKIADIVGGDPAVCEVARLMRVPGSHNTKGDKRIPVQVIADRPIRHELDDLIEWAHETRVLVPRKGEARQPSNPFLDTPVPNCGGPAVDVGARLAAMRFQGTGDSAIHQTQVNVTAAMLNQGVGIGETVSKVLAATRAAAGPAGAKWDWSR